MTQPPAIILEPNADEMFAYLMHLYGGHLDGCHDGKIEFSWSNPKTGSLTKGRLFGTDEIEQLVDMACRKNRTPNCNVYHGAALRLPETPDGRTSNDDFYALTAYYADLDKDGAADNARQRLIDHHNGCLPTIIVCTGAYPHVREQCWWRLETPNRDPEQCRAIANAMATALDGDFKVKNAGRLMRLGGSIAWPVKEGRIKEVTRVYIPDGTRNIYRDGEVERAFAPQSYAHIQTPLLSGGGEIIKDGLDRVVDGREQYMMAVIARVIADIVRDTMRYPTEGEVFDKGWPVYASKVKARTGSLEAEGRGESEFRKKIAYALRRAAEGKIKGLENPEDAFLSAAVEKAFAADDAGAVVDDRPDPFMASTLGRHPPPREWIIDEWLPYNSVTAMYGDGGTGKTLLAQQLAACFVSGREWLGLPMKMKGTALCICCEDDRNELWRRQIAIENSLNIFNNKEVEKLWLWPVLGYDNFLCETNSRNKVQFSQVYYQVYQKIEQLKPDLLILDTAADMFSGNENARSEVNFFLKVVLSSFCTQLNTTVLLLAHPSVAGLSSGTGLSGSTAWNNSVRSRWYLNRKEEGTSDERVLTRKKANYSRSGDDERIDIIWHDGAFVVPHIGTPDLMDRIEQRVLKDQILEAIDEAWNKGTPITKAQGARPYKDVLPRLLREEPKLICKAVKDLELSGVIATSKNSNKRGYYIVARPK